MSPKQRHIKSQSNINYEEPYAIITPPTNATFIPTETVETDEEKDCSRQESEIVYAQSILAKNKEAKRQEETSCAGQIMENEAIGFA
tara:strand:- start:37 stop:297 length:261 start_codon:yes stop_codon:yes gene_type:complete